MRMKKFSKFFMSMLAMCTIAACSNDELENKPVVDPGASTDAVYMNVTVQLPTGPGTRSNTKPEGGSSDGTEVGQDYENKVVSVLLVLAKTDNTLIGCAEKTEGTPKEENGNITAVQSISKSELGAYYGDDKKLTAEEQTIRVFVFCNPTDALKRIFAGVSAGDATWYDQICTISEVPNGECDNAAIWGGSNHQNGFLMSSYEIAEKKLPKDFADWDNFTKAENPFRLTGMNLNILSESEGKIDNGNAIKVERSVARFDFRDGSKNSDGTAANDNTYNVIYDDPKLKTNCLVQIKLEKMALVNMSKNFYYLRRVSDNGLGANSQLCETEINSNYVVDTDATEKDNGSIIANKTFSNHFNFCLGHTKEDGTWTIDETAREQWSTSLISEVLDNEDDNDDDWNSNKTKGNYKIWRYVTENTIPGDVSNQKQGISTGIVFKGKMIATDYDTNSELYKALTNTGELKSSDPILYAYGEDLYVRWTEVRAMAIEQGANSPMYKAVFGNTSVEPKVEKGTEKAVYSNDAGSPDAKWNAWYNEEGVTDDTRDPKKLATFKESATEGAGFTLYERSYDQKTKSYGYYCYYYYWNRHNDNGNNGVMRTMEFAVVRNNVYKLAVNSISKLGHPRISDNDPDPVDPDDPDEDGDVYISVSVEVLPWVVRINNIDF